MRILTLVALAIAACAATPLSAQDDQLVKVRVKAEGLSRDDAIRQALRAAVEQGAGVRIESYSQTEDFVLVRDTIYSRAAGFVSEYDVLDEKPGADGTVVVEIEALVRVNGVVETWGAVQHLLDQMGRPKMMVLIDEYVDGRLQADSFVAARIEQMFTEAGFEMVERSAIEELRRREDNEARLRGDDGKLQRLAKDAGAHIFIRGTAHANPAGLEDLYGVPAAFYNCDVIAKAYWTDTGKLMTTQSLPVTRKGVRSRTAFSPQAARAALVAATFPEQRRANTPTPLAIRLRDAILEQWSTQLTVGGDITVELAGMNFGRYSKIKTALAEHEHIDGVSGDLTNGTGVYRVTTKLSAESLAKLLSKPPFDDLIEITDLKPNRIQGKVMRR